MHSALSNIDNSFYKFITFSLVMEFFMNFTTYFTIYVLTTFIIYKYLPKAVD